MSGRDTGSGLAWLRLSQDFLLLLALWVLLVAALFFFCARDSLDLLFENVQESGPTLPRPVARPAAPEGPEQVQMPIARQLADGSSLDDAPLPGLVRAQNGHIGTPVVREEPGLGYRIDISLPGAGEGTRLEPAQEKKRSVIRLQIPGHRVLDGREETIVNGRFVRSLRRGVSRDSTQLQIFLTREGLAEGRPRVIWKDGVLGIRTTGQRLPSRLPFIHIQFRTLSWRSTPMENFIYHDLVANVSISNGTTRMDFYDETPKAPQQTETISIGPQQPEYHFSQRIVLPIAAAVQLYGLLSQITGKLVSEGVVSQKDVDAACGNKAS